MVDNAVDIDLHHLISFGRPTALPKKRIIVHTTENKPGTPSRAILDYQVRTQTGSYHRLVDHTGQITLANTDDWQTWSVGNKGNDIALHVSCVAFAAMDRAQWLAQPKMLEGVARVIAHWSRLYDIPLVKLSRAELGAGKYGVAGHLEAQVWGNTDHWDPGYHFPYDVVLARAKQIKAGVSTKPAVPAPAAKPSPQPAATAKKEANTVTKIQSLINPDKSFTAEQMTAINDARAFRMDAKLDWLIRQLGADPKEIEAAAVAADLKGTK